VYQGALLMIEESKKMIYTVTFNPSLDYIVSVKEFALGKTNRTVTEKMLPGGKGINVSTVLCNLGMETTALGFTAGFVGDEIERRIGEAGFASDFIHLRDGCSRINVKMKDFEGTEINGMGPVIDSESVELLFQQLKKLRAGDVLVLAGSIPAGMPSSVYSDILLRLTGRGVLTVVDASGELLCRVLSYHPFLIKPNNHELGELFGVQLTRKSDTVSYARRLQEMGARNVLVSMAGRGAVFVSENGTAMELEAPDGKLVNAVGAGDSMVAGFLAGWLESGDYEKAFRMSVAAGSASAYSELLATREQIIKLYDKMNREAERNTL